MELHSYFRSSAAYRVRIALEIKGLEHQIIPIDLTTGQQRGEDYLISNPQGLVPALTLDSGDTLAQSGAILEWLEETHPSPPLYPQNPILKAQHRALCQHIACDIHPLNNLRVLRYLGGTLGLKKDQIDDWYAHWINLGFTAIESALGDFAGNFSLTENPGMFEVFLIPQVYNAYRFQVDLSPFPGIVALDKRCQRLPAFAKAHPSAQPDSPSEARS
ncbi:maleylacetoacetate isomerase [Congregibacter variabilis]|uniref:Maleylacetoacetate isomerase n=1 Tax=Congregibacter variabilis TaxID=3081200 RepID=A0ABZ0I187_9GAMM|nr:maleylacetoacetate isomerase [Congregibacter sp. IMCC43200]